MSVHQGRFYSVNIMQNMQFRYDLEIKYDDVIDMFARALQNILHDDA